MEQGSTMGNVDHRGACCNPKRPGGVLQTLQDQGKGFEGEKDDKVAIEKYIQLQGTHKAKRNT